MVEDPLPVTVAGLNADVTPAGSPLTLNPTLPVKPFSADTLTVYPALLPAVTDWLGGAAVTEKSGLLPPNCRTTEVDVFGFTTTPVLVVSAKPDAEAVTLYVPAGSPIVAKFPLASLEAPAEKPPPVTKIWAFATGVWAEFFTMPVILP